MLRSNVTNSLAAAAVSFFAAYAATAQEVKNLPADATAHFIYFPTGGYKLDAKDQDQIRDVAGMIQSHPDFVATILGKTDSVGFLTRRWPLAAVPATDAVSEAATAPRPSWDFPAAVAVR